MAYRYRPVDRDQRFLFPPDMREWLSADHVVHFLIAVIEAMDVSRFEPAKRSGAGRAAYDPRMLLTLLVYAYAGGVRSSRRIERLCEQDVAFRFICAQDAPDHVTLARFRRRHFGVESTMADFFAEVLALAAKAGLGRLGEIALDGTKIGADASKEANRTERRLREMAEAVLAEAEQTDAAEDALFGDDRGDEVPEDLVDPVSRAQRITAALADLEAERARAAEQAAQRERAAEDYLNDTRAGRAPRGAPPAQAAVAAATERLERAIAAQQAKIAEYEAQRAAAIAAGHRGLPGGPPQPVEEHAGVRNARAALARAEQTAAKRAEKGAAQSTKEPVRNITDPDSRLMPVRGGGFIQGYNAQVVRSQDGLVLATCVGQQPPDTAYLQPMMQAAVTAGRLLRRHATSGAHRRGARIGTLLADAGYLSTDNLTSPGPDRLIAVGKHRDLERAARENPHTGPTDQPEDEPIAAMTKRLKTPEGIATYRRRGPLAETPFADLKHNRGFRRFQLRGLPRVQGEWTFANAVSNLLLIHRTGWNPHPA
jgi:transposase